MNNAQKDAKDRKLGTLEQIEESIESREESNFNKGGVKETSSSLYRPLVATVMSKRTLRVPKIMPSIDPDRTLFPRGVLTLLKESREATHEVKRIEIFANKSKEGLYGILRRMFVAFSSERELLQIARASDNVIEVRSFSQSGSSSFSSPESGRVIEDRLVLKRIEEATPDEHSETVISFRKKPPKLLVPAAWLERVDLEDGSQIIVSNPMARFVIPPPHLEDIEKKGKIRVGSDIF